MNLLQKLSQKLGSYCQRKAGEEFQFTCPRCHHVKLEINPRKQVFHCFRCHYKGTLGQMLRDLNILPYSVVKVESIEKPVVIEPQECRIPGYKYGHTSVPIHLYLQRRGYLNLEFGVSSDPMLKGRMIVPIREDGKIVSYLARAVDDSQPKELSGPNRGWYLYNIDEVKEGEPVVLVEGIFDCEAVRRAGYISCAVMGSNLTDIQIGKLLAKKPSAIILLFDGDLAGRQANFKAYAKLIERNPPPVLLAWIPNEQDPDELPTEDLQQLIKQLGF